MSAPTEEPLVTDDRSRIIRPEVVLLEIGDGFHSQSNRVYDDARNVSACPKGMLGILLNIWRIQYCHRQRNDPDPDHLEDPKGKEFKKSHPSCRQIGRLSSLEDTKEEES